MNKAVRISADFGQCEAYTRRLERCQHFGPFDNYHFAILCDQHADMEDPPMTLPEAHRQRKDRDNRLHHEWRERQAS